jgi:dienelactone hydrolase
MRSLYSQPEWFRAWMNRRGEKPPDYDALRPMPDLPPLLQFQDGGPVRSIADWAKRRQELGDLLDQYFWGREPDTAPQLERAEVVAEARDRGVIRRRIGLHYRTTPAVSITIDTLTPDRPGAFPLFLTQSSHRMWASMAAARGYLACVYPGGDDDDQSVRFVDVYPDCDWTTIPRRAWLAGRALDYLLTLDEADPGHVGITGHSRNGKQALIAAARDTRITAVVSSSSGAGGATPFRFCSEREFLESVEWITWTFPDWFNPRLRFFTGREQLLPVDAHAYLALIAPRACLISTALNDGCESSFGVERAYRAAREVYDFLGAPEALRIRWRAGGHDTCAEDIHGYLDWFDNAFGRTEVEFPEWLLHHFDWQGWRSKAPDAPAPPTASADAPESIRAAIHWALGDAPPDAAAPGGRGGEPDSDAALMQRGGAPAGVTRVPIHFGEYVLGDLYGPAEVKGPLPAVVWLHPYSFPLGYPGAYVMDHHTLKPYRVFLDLARRGFACLAFDQLGFGRRTIEGARFYDRYPQWSKLGKMVRDVQSAVDFLAAQVDSDLAASGPKPALPALDPQRIFCLGYSLGAMVALYAAALDRRITGVASFCGFTPMRADTDDAPTGGLRRLWEWYGLQPRLGHFHARERDLPYDFDGLLALIAPRPCLVVAPAYDRDADAAEVTACVARARAAWDRAGAPTALEHQAPEDYNRFQPEQFQIAFEWLERVAAH